MQKTQLKAGYYFIKIKGQDGVKIAQSPGIRLGEGKFGRIVYDFMLFGGRNFLNLDSVEGIFMVLIPDEEILKKMVPLYEQKPNLAVDINIKLATPIKPIKPSFKNGWKKYRGLEYYRDKNDVISVRKDKLVYNIGDDIGTKGHNGVIKSFELVNYSTSKANILVRFTTFANDARSEQTVLLQNIFKFQ